MLTLQIHTLLRLLVTSPVAPRCRAFLAGLENFLPSASHQRRRGGFTSSHEPRLQVTRMGRSRAGCRELLGGVLPAAAPRGGRPGDGDSNGDGDGVGVCSQPSAQRAGRKRAAELAPALLTHQLVPESNHRLVFNEHLSWKAGNPLVSCFARWLVFLARVFSFWLFISFHPLSPRWPLERNTRK